MINSINLEAFVALKITLPVLEQFKSQVYSDNSPLSPSAKLSIQKLVLFACKQSKICVGIKLIFI